MTNKVYKLETQYFSRVELNVHDHITSDIMYFSSFKKAKAFVESYNGLTVDEPMESGGFKSWFITDSKGDLMIGSIRNILIH